MDMAYIIRKLYGEYEKQSLYFVIEGESEDLAVRSDIIKIMIIWALKFPVQEEAKKK